MRHKKIRTIIVTMLLLTLLCAMVTTASAKTYYTTSSGHAAVRYDHSDISPAMRPFVDIVEYDLICSHESGVRLCFTSWGKTAVVLYPSLAEAMARDVMAAPEWIGDRSLRSVEYEIYQHAVWPNRMIVHIESYYASLQSWEVPYNHL